MIMAAADLLARNPNPSEEEVRHGLEGNLCRCTGYHNIVEAGARGGRERSARMTTYVGQAMKRKEDPRMITGRANYVDDIALPGMLHAAIVRSPEAHATIVSIDKSAAEDHPGVVAVLHGRGPRRRLRVGPPDGLGPARRRDQDARALAAQARRGRSTWATRWPWWSPSTATWRSTPPRT